VYKKFFGLKDDPFNIVPDPRYLFSTAETDEAFANLIFGVHAHKGLILLTGEVGTGKTILLKKLVDRLQHESAATAFVFNPRLNPTEFFDYVLSDFGVAHDPHDKPRMLRTLYRWLRERLRVSQTTVLIVDEAHDLTPEVFEELRLLSNLETPTEKLLQIILSGQPEIEEKLAHPELRLFRQRIALRRRIHALTREETERYTAHRLRVAGGNPAQVFSPEAMASVFEFSQGIPRVINLICEQALISAYADQRKPIRAETIREAAAQYKLVSGTLPSSLPSNASVQGIESLTQSILEMTTSKASSAPSETPLSSLEPVGPQGAPKSPASAEASAEAPPVPPPTEMANPASSAAPADVQALSPPSAELEGPVTESEAEVIRAPIVPPKRGVESGTRTLDRSSAPSPPLTPLHVKSPERDKTHDAISARLESAPHIKPDGKLHTSAAQLSHEMPAAEPNPPTPPARTPKPQFQSPASQPGTLAETRRAPARVAPVPLQSLTHARPKGRSSSLLWTVLIILVAGCTLGGYYFARGNRRMLANLWRAATSAQESVSAANPSGSSSAPKPVSSRPIAKDRTNGTPSTPGQTNALTGGNKRSNGAQVRNVGGQIANAPAAAPRTGPPRMNQERPRAPNPDEELARSVPAPIPAERPGQLFITANVTGATIKLDDKSNPAWVTPHTFTNLRPGAHVLDLSQPGYAEIRQSVDVESDRVMIVSATMTALSAELIITTAPPGADVSIDGKPYGSSPVRIRLVAGRHTYRVQMAGRETQEGTVNVPENGMVAKSVELPPAAPSAPEMNVQVTTIPPNATVFADGTPMGDTPTSFHMSPGHHTLILFASGFEPLRREIEVPESGIVRVNETLASR
jgi:general secretion pathway protein A